MPDEGKYSPSDVTPDPQQQQGQYSAADVQGPEAVLDPSSPTMQNNEGAVSRFLHDTWNHLNPLPAIQEFMHRPDATGVAWRALNAGMRIRAGKEQPGDRELLEKGMQANLNAGDAAPPIVPSGSEPLAEAGAKAAAGDYAGAGGTLVGTGIPLAASAWMADKNIPVRALPKKFVTNPNVKVAGALDYLESEGVPGNFAARTGNEYAKHLQKGVDLTPLGSVVSADAAHETTEKLGQLGNRLADRAHPTPVVPEQAGEGVHTAVQARAEDFGKKAENAYGQFHQIEEDPMSLRTVQTGTRQVPVLNVQGNPVPGRYRTVPVTEDIPMPVDAIHIQEMLEPIYEDMKKWMEPAKRNASPGFQAIESIVKGPRYLRASQAEAGLGGLKELARDGEGRNAGLAKYVIPELQSAIDDAVADVGGRPALTALQRGRAMTARQYATQAVFDKLRTEPVQAFGQLTWAKDANIDFLRKVATEAPGELPKVGRAWLEDLFRRAQAEGGWGRTQSVWNDWQNLGPETKKLLFRDPAYIDQLEKFFLGAKKLAEHPNPSGSGAMGAVLTQTGLALTHPQTGIPYIIGAGALSKLMHSTSGVKLLTQAMTLPGKYPAAALAAAQILKQAGNDATQTYSREWPQVKKAADAQKPASLKFSEDEIRRRAAANGNNPDEAVAMAQQKGLM